MEEDRDILVFVDENEEEIEMEILDYFIHEDQEYALLTQIEDCDCPEDDHVHDHEHELYIMKVMVNGDIEEFQPVEEENMESLIQAVEALFSDMDQVETDRVKAEE